jgi:hypothetical protein
LSEPASADDPDVHLPSFLGLGGEQVAHREAAVRPPALASSIIGLGRQMVEPIQALD